MKKPSLLITSQNGNDDPYQSSIISFAIGQFPMVAIKNTSQRLDALTEAILSSNRIRLGPLPPPENIVAIRSVLTTYMERDEPIPFIIPWGSEKPDGSSIDIAELCALKTLVCLQRRITEHYTPGTQMRIPIEDASAPYLFHERSDEAYKEARRYTTDFSSLIWLLELNGFIKPVPESSLVTPHQFEKHADIYTPTFESVINKSLPQSSLASLGWKGKLADDTINYYMMQYAKLYPEKSVTENQHTLARYLSSSLVRSKYGLRNIPLNWNNTFLELAFMSVPPGIDHARFARRIVYRTVPSNLTANHIPPWRAKGYLAIAPNGTATPKLTTFREELPLNPFCLRFTNDNTFVDVKADYVTL